MQTFHPKICPGRNPDYTVSGTTAIPIVYTNCKFVTGSATESYSGSTTTTAFKCTPGNAIAIVPANKDDLKITSSLSFGGHQITSDGITIIEGNKDDLDVRAEDIKRIYSIYEPLGYKIVVTSATEKHGIKTFRELLENNTSVLCGNSGVGKSSLINAINPDLNLKTKAVSEKLQRGTHTTRHCEIIKLDKTSRIVDTPGFSNVRFDFILPADVDLLFDEMRPYREFCKYADCLHINEDGCAVLDNIDKIDASRYESYLEFIKEAKEYKEKIKYEGKKTEQTKKFVHNKEITKISEKKRQTSRRRSKQDIYKDIEYHEEDE